MSTKNTSTGPTVEELKEQFKARSIPLESDFAELIDIADIGRKAAGLSPEQDPNTQSGLTLDAQDQLVIKVMPNTGVVVNDKGVGLVPEQQFHAGMIMMFSGATVPAGWALCNGNSGTPDLRNRFILGGGFEDIGGLSENKTMGTINKKTYIITTDSQSQQTSVKVNSHSLEYKEMPRHKHGAGMRIYQGSNEEGCAVYGYLNRGTNTKVKMRSVEIDRNNRPTMEYYTSDEGSGHGHNHTATVSNPGHLHNVEITTPYYTLAFIIKV
jgi:microcystin-dependent protein